MRRGAGKRPARHRHGKKEEGRTRNAPAKGDAEGPAAAPEASAGVDVPLTRGLLETPGDEAGPLDLVPQREGPPHHRDERAGEQHQDDHGPAPVPGEQRPGVGEVSRIPHGQSAPPQRRGDLSRGARPQAPDATPRVTRAPTRMERPESDLKTLAHCTPGAGPRSVVPQAPPQGVICVRPLLQARADVVPTSVAMAEEIRPAEPAELAGDDRGQVPAVAQHEAAVDSPRLIAVLAERKLYVRLYCSSPHRPLHEPSTFPTLGPSG